MAVRVTDIPVWHLNQLATHKTLAIHRHAITGVIALLTGFYVAAVVARKIHVRQVQKCLRLLGLVRAKILLTVKAILSRIMIAVVSQPVGAVYVTVTKATCQ